MKVFIFTLFSLACLQAEELADPLVTGPGVEMKLISETETVVPGRPFTVGLHLKHFPGFHTYWLNPGMVGLATSLEWNLPEGFVASPIQWPYPENTFMGEYPCHGYEREVTLLTTIIPPAEIAASEITLAADTLWMCCAKGCFPGSETFSLTPAVGSEIHPNPEALALIEKARAELPTTDHTLQMALLTDLNAPQISLRFTDQSKKPLEPDESWFLFSEDRQVSSDQKKFSKPKLMAP